MRLSSLLGRTLREPPAEAEQIGHQLALRAGLARALAPGSFALLPLGLAATRRIEALMREELTRLGGQEARLPLVLPVAFWERTGHDAVYGPLMLRLRDRAERPLALAPTHEAALVELARREIGSYRQLPALVYAIQPVYRDEARVRGGLLGLREFTLLTACSFDADPAGLDAAFTRVGAAFERVFARCGVRCVAVEAAGSAPDEGEARAYMALSPFGDDTLAVCRACGYGAAIEVAACARTTPPPPAEAPPLEEVATPGASTIAGLAAFLGISEAATAKAVFFDTPERGLLFVVIRGDLEVNEARLRAAAGVSELRPAEPEHIAATGTTPGYASPVGLKGVFVVADRSVVEAGPLVAGANRPGYHLRNVVHGRDWHATLVADIAAVRAGDPCARCGAPLRLEQGVEIGHIRKVGTGYSQVLGATCLDERGLARPLALGAYVIGVERLLQMVIEQHHDERGIIWPAAVAPADVHIIALGKGEAPRVEAARLYDELAAAGLRPLLDDRDESAGVKFNDADLIGLPLRLVVGEKLLATGEVELKPRRGEAARVARAEAVEAIRGALA
ncbi:MAG: proline--tRNA ligase [Oscillochloridaceae bacterium]|nr:proline--tRNA ligase [Chloroflexaceae bacterium]MDW8390504.1 proline--tRNA ligase [Oscillochloridaceae bacterium]